MKQKLCTWLLLLFTCAKLAVAQTDTDFANQNNQFGINFYQAVAKEKSPTENLVFSPLCLSNVLSMAYWGAKGSTAQQFEAILQCQNTNPYRESYARFIRSLPRNDETYQTQLVNAIWLQKEFSLQTAYKDVLTNTFNNKPQIVDFAKNRTEAEKQINDWVTAQTREKITELVPPNSLSSDTRLVLTNALYFDGKWLSNFEENNTKDATFFAPQEEVKTAMMSQKSDIFHWESENFISATLLFTSSQYMTFVMPKAGYTLPDLEKLMTPAFYQSNFAFTFEDLLAEKTVFKSKLAYLYLPRFKMDVALGAKTALESMGLKHAFGMEGQADFSGITGDNSLKIDDVLHKTFLDVNETGVEAASATAVIFEWRGAEEPIELKFNRPFLFFICDGNSGAILFQGRLVNPAKN